MKSMAMPPGGAEALACAPQLRLACALLCSVVSCCLAAANLVAAWNFGWDLVGASSSEGLLWALATTAICASKMHPPLRRSRGSTNRDRLRSILLAPWWAAATMLSLMAWMGVFAALPPQLVSAAGVLAHISALSPATLEFCLVAFCAGAFEVLSVLTTSCARHQWQYCARYARGGATTPVRCEPDRCPPHGWQLDARRDNRQPVLHSKSVSTNVSLHSTPRLRAGAPSRPLARSAYPHASWRSGSENSAAAHCTRLAEKIDKSRCATQALRVGERRLQSERWPRAP
jgi:hypothetical protein